MKELLIEVINAALDKYTFDMATYVIMNNHFHFLIKTVENGEDISTILQYIKGNFARKYNKLTNRTGPFWNERFGDTIIDHSDDPVFLFNYIIWYFGFNPVRKGMVKDPRDYIYGSLNFFLDETYIPRVKLSYHKYFLQLGKTFKERVDKFLVFEEFHRKRLYVECLFN